MARAAGVRGSEPLGEHERHNKRALRGCAAAPLGERACHNKRALRGCAAASR